MLLRSIQTSTSRPARRRFGTAGLIAIGLLVSITLGCASVQGPYTTRRDKTAKGAGIGAAAGAAAALLDGKREADELLAGAAIGAAVGGGVGVYLDAQEEKLARIPGTSVERIGKDTLLVHFDSDILFGVNSATLGSSARSSLHQVADVLIDYPKTAVVIQGHTDATGTEDHNQTLSERRANAVRGYLASLGVAPDRLAAIGYGEGMPIADNDTASGRRLNRRVDVLLRARAR